jgi:hypothetical protein
MSYETLPIVGSFYRPPAKLLLENLAIGTPLTLLAEPENAYDPNAVAVWLRSADIPAGAYASLGEVLPNFGLTLDAVLEQEQWHMGYVPKEFAMALRHHAVVETSVPLAVTFAVNAKGYPRVRFQQPVL